MRKKIQLMILTLGLLFASTAMAAQPIAISHMQVDFGRMTEGPVAQKTVTLTNVSKEVVTIQNVTTSWSCTSTALGQSSIEPGQSAKLVISYNTFKYPGAFNKTVTVSTGKGQENSQTIHIVGYVEPIPMGVMEVTPRKTLVDGLVNGKTTPARIMIKNTGDAPMTVTAVTSHKFKTTYWQGELTLAAGESAPVEFELKPQNQGRFMDIIMVYSDARNDIGKGYKAVLMGAAK